MIQPDHIPQINGDIEAVARYGQTLKARGKEFADTGLDVHTTWQGLAAFYHAPEAVTLLTATAPVKTKAAHFGHDLNVVGDALIAYADTVRPLQQRLSDLWGAACAFRALYVDGHDDWNKDRHNVAENNRLITEVDAAVAQWQAAERTCANRINALFGGIHWAQDNLDGDHQDNEYGYSSDAYDQAAQHDGGLWGKAAEHDLIWWKDAWNDVVYFREGSRQTGLAILTGAYDLVNFTDLPTLKSSWRGLYVLSLAMNPGPSSLVDLNNVTPVLGVRKGELEQTREATIKGFLSWDEWKENPAKAAGGVTINIASLVLGPEDLAAGATFTTVSDIAKLGSRSAEHLKGLRPLTEDAGEMNFSAFGRGGDEASHGPTGLHADGLETEPIPVELPDAPPLGDSPEADSVGIKSEVAARDTAKPAVADSGHIDDASTTAVDSQPPRLRPLAADGLHQSVSDHSDSIGEPTASRHEAGFESPHEAAQTPHESAGVEEPQDAGDARTASTFDPSVARRWEFPTAHQTHATAIKEFFKQLKLPRDHFGQFDTTKIGPVGERYHRGIDDPTSSFIAKEKSLAAERAAEGRLVTRIPEGDEKSIDTIERIGPDDPGRRVEYKQLDEPTFSSTKNAIRYFLEKFELRANEERLEGDAIIDGRPAGIDVETAMRGIRARLGPSIEGNSAKLAQAGWINLLTGDGHTITYLNDSKTILLDGREVARFIGGKWEQL